MNMIGLNRRSNNGTIIISGHLHIEIYNSNIWILPEFAQLPQSVRIICGMLLLGWTNKRPGDGEKKKRIFAGKCFFQRTVRAQYSALALPRSVKERRRLVGVFHHCLKLALGLAHS